MIDLHNHSLPGVDDGATNFEESLELIRNLSEHGITDIFLTPHYIHETDQSPTCAHNIAIYNNLRKVVSSAKIPVKLYLGNEIYISRNIKDLVASDKIKPLGNSNYLLIELPMSGEYPNYEGILMQLLSDGFKVILAHPERYHTFQKNYSLILDLNSIGVLFQCNLGSIIGQYGHEPKKTLIKMAKDDLIFSFGTDIHHPRNYREIDLAIKALRKYYSDDRLEDVLTKNASLSLLS